MACSVPGCGRVVYALGLCGPCYKRQRRNGTTTPIRPKGSLRERFEAKINKTEYCWFWTSTKRPNGYGQIQEGGGGSRTLSAHRLAYEFANGEIPDGAVVMHTCDNRACVNPAHLRLGTHSDNTRDAIDKGRFPQLKQRKRARGEKHGNAVLTTELARRIKASKHSSVDIAAHLGCDPSTLNSLRSGETWAHVQPHGDEEEFPIVAVNRHIKYGVHHNSKFTAEQIQYIRSSPKTGLALAQEFGVVKQTIYRIRAG